MWGRTLAVLLCLLETKRGWDGKCNDKANLSLDLPGASQLCLSHPRLPPSLPPSHCAQLGSARGKSSSSAWESKCGVRNRPW